MRRCLKSEALQNRVGMDFHPFVEREHLNHNHEVIEKFGVSLEAVKKLKKQIQR